MSPKFWRVASPSSSRVVQCIQKVSSFDWSGFCHAYLHVSCRCIESEQWNKAETDATNPHGAFQRLERLHAVQTSLLREGHAVLRALVLDLVAQVRAVELVEIHLHGVTWLHDDAHVALILSAKSMKCREDTTLETNPISQLHTELGHYISYSNVSLCCPVLFST